MRSLTPSQLINLTTPTINPMFENWNQTMHFIAHNLVDICIVIHIRLIASFSIDIISILIGIKWSCFYMIVNSIYTKECSGGYNLWLPICHAIKMRQQIILHICMGVFAWMSRRKLKIAYISGFSVLLRFNASLSSNISIML